jgi:hypothetical protein
LRLSRCVLASNLFPFARKEGGEPIRVEDVHHRVDDQASFERTYELAGASHRELPGPCDMNDRIV